MKSEMKVKINYSKQKIKSRFLDGADALIGWDCSLAMPLHSICTVINLV